ncbi:MDR family oxidoreductase [Tropicimonas isoalkanivorans]|uniref:Putative quinone oxidoreductase, YhdH/YhfP family n=1 Tax=Tropicimonas isoalkanivorans TaxID=441112 RepID=A0A1I1DQS5_9RHOB|nr:MDR family oxidoreductase [Tropicimonas isoalkanivorans]SFB74913.1 putative quinone oxidoreductase, YhdH/YhfP family [Tropicimonas isoalkanivorans]
MRALIVEKSEDGKTSASVQEIDESRLPEGEVTVRVEYSTLNYKDGLCIGPGAGLVRTYPHVPGIDFAGTVKSSEDDRYKPGDKVVLTGWRVGEVHWGGYAEKARVKADWLVPLPEGLTTKQAMAVGTAGLTAMLAIMALQNHGLRPENGEVLVTGATGGVGSVATAILSNLGYEVAAVTGRPEQSQYLSLLGAQKLITRDDLAETVKKPLEKESWAGCIDAVGGPMLARVLGQMKYGASVASVGLAGGADLPAKVTPFILRGVNLLGIDSVMQPFENRQRAWARIASDLPMDRLQGMMVEATLEDLPKLGADILKGKVRGRVLVDVNA